jgi:hypothetical protein
MNNYGAYGGLGGLGGYPMRHSAPSSSVVSAAPEMSHAEWLADWERRYSDVANSASPDRWVEGGWVTPDTMPGGPQAYFTRFGHKTVGDEDAADGVRLRHGATQYGARPGGNFGWMTEGLMPSGWVAGNTPNFDALNAERDRLLPMYESMTRNQQSYDSMMGGHQTNATIGENYADANFGSVSGQVNQALPTVDGVGMSWANGVYDPAYASGLYGSSGKARNTDGWL